MVGLLLVTFLWTLCSSLPLEPLVRVNETIVSEDSTVDIITSDDTDVNLDVDGVHYHIVGSNAREGRHASGHDHLEISSQDGVEVSKYLSNPDVGDEINLDDGRGGFIKNSFNLGDIDISGSVHANRISIGSHVNIGNFDHEDMDEDDHNDDHTVIGHNVNLPDIVVSDLGLNAEDHKDLKAAFRYIDDNGDELLSADELFEACEKLDIKITAEGTAKMVLISSDQEDKSAISYVKFGLLLKFAPSFNKRDLIHYWVHAAGFHHGHDFEMDDDVTYRRHLDFVFLILDQDHDGQLTPIDLMMSFQDMGGALGQTEAEMMFAHHMAGESYGFTFDHWTEFIDKFSDHFHAENLAIHWRKIFRFYAEEGDLTGYHRRHVDSGVRRAVGNQDIVDQLVNLPAVTQCPPIKVEAVEDAWIEVVEGLNYKLKIIIKTQSKIGASCSEEVLKVCDNVVVFKPLPNFCKGVHCLQLQDTEQIKCHEVSPTLERCIDECQLESCQNHRDLSVGCNKIYTCAHGCQMRHLGLDEDACRDQCGHDDDCDPVVQGWKFDLCQDCHRHGCSTQVPAECEQGCRFYSTDVPHLSNPDAVEQVADANRKFACALYNTVKTPELVENWLVSPYSASSVMAMAYMGAEGETRRQIMDGMFFPEKKTLAEGYKDVFRVLKGNHHFNLVTANNLFVHNGFELLDEFKATMKEYFNSEVKQVDFSKAEEAPKEINDWVKKQTNNKIEELISEDFFTSYRKNVMNDDAFVKELMNANNEELAELQAFLLNKAVLVNAIYFKGDWVHQFAEEYTREEDFYATDGEPVKVMMMHNRLSAFKMCECEGKNLQARTIELPYEGDRISMYIVLPNEKDGLDEVETLLCEKTLKAELIEVDRQEKRQISLFLPKFKMDKSIHLSSNLKALGMTDMFSSRADFSGINGKNDLSVMDVIQKSFLEVDEFGSEAAAASAVTMGLTSSPDTPTLPEFKCDHPFLFFIYDKLTNMMLFRGRVVHPTPASPNDISTPTITVL